MKMRTLLPSLKEKKRYLAFELLCEKKLNKIDVEKSFYAALLQFLGEKGMAESRVTFLSETFSENRGIIQCGHKHVEDVRASLALIREISENSVIFHSLYVSGLIGKAKQILLNPKKK